MVPVPKTKYLRDTFRLTPAQWLKIWEFQGGKCALCPKSLEEHKPYTDHDHKDGLLRGLLCFRCNNSVRENVSVEWLQKLVVYMLNPPASRAFGHPHYGFPGRVGTKKQRALARKARAQETMTPLTPLSGNTQ